MPTPRRLPKDVRKKRSRWSGKKKKPTATGFRTQQPWKLALDCAVKRLKKSGKKELNTLGIDPDLHATAVSWVSWAPHTGDQVYQVEIAAVPKDIYGQACTWHVAMALELLDFPCSDIDLVLVEGQSMRGNKTPNPQNIIDLAQTAGAAIGHFSLLGIPAAVAPVDQWKGQLPKHVHQARDCADLGWDYLMAGGKDPYVVPVDLPPVLQTKKSSDWKHLMDSVGIGLWGLRKLKEEIHGIRSRRR